MVTAESGESRAGGGRRALLRRHWHPVVVLVATVVLIGGVVRDVVLSTDWPVGGDLASHLVAIAWLREHGLHSWTFGWFGGMPLFYFYFPLPAAIGVTFAEWLGLGVAMRLLVVMGPLALPLAVLFLARAAGATRLEAAAAGLGGVVFLHLRSMMMLGGTLEASAIGEYSYSIALALGLAYLGVVWPGRARPGRLLVAAPLLAAVALSHLIVVMLVVLASTAVLFRRGRQGTVVVVGSWALGFMLSAFWTVPFLVRMPEMAEIWWRRGDPGIPMLFGLTTLPLAVLALVGLTLDRRRLTRVSPYAALGAAGLLPLAVPVPFFPQRGLPLVMLGLCVLASVSVVSVASAARAVRAPVRVASALLAALMLLGVAAMWPVNRSPMVLLLRGAEAPPDRAEWEEMRRVLAALPPGAFVWGRSPPTPGGDPAFSMFRYTLDQLPLLDGRRTLGGLLQESAPTSQYVREAQRNLSGFRLSTIEPFADSEADFSLGLAQAAVLGVRYLVLSGDPVLSAAREHDMLEIQADSGSWAIGELPDAAVALAFTDIPTDPCTSERECRGWFATAPGVVGTVVGQWGEEDIQLGVEAIHFRTAHPGKPHLIRLSYFPGWRLETPGEGPRRFGPGQMLITPQSTDVVLRFSRGWPVVMGRALTLLGLLILVALTIGLIPRNLVASWNIFPCIPGPGMPCW
jgi:hypothetical protein